MISRPAPGPTPASDSPPETVAYRALSQRDLPAATVPLATELLGALLVRRFPEGEAVGRIVETEAYEVGDPSSHAFRGRTNRCASMFLAVGHSYVYRIYGTSFCLNIASEREGEGAAILVRAVEPLAGIDLLRARRPGIRDRDLVRGPGRLCTAFAIGPELDGLPLFDEGAGVSPLFLARDAAPPPRVGASTRIGLTKAAHYPHRFYVRGSAWVSGPRGLSPA
jgi:DNA-3-methyladenine glycosylase